jgi:hypothetical protein
MLHFHQEDRKSRERRYMPVIPTLRRLKEEDCEFETRLDYTVNCCFKKKKIFFCNSASHLLGRHSTTLAILPALKKIISWWALVAHTCNPKP